MNIPWEAIVTVIIFLLVQLGGFLWAMAVLKTTVDLKFSVLTDAVQALTLAVKNTWNKEDALREIGRIEGIAKAAHQRIDDINGHSRDRQRD